MKFTAEAKDLQAAIAAVVKALSSKPTMPILEGIYIEANTDGLLLRCSDLFLQIDSIISAQVEEEGAIVMPGRLFAEVVRKASGEEISFVLQNKTMLIKAGRAKTNLQCIDAAEFPDMRIKGDVQVVSIPQNVCKDMIRQSVFATAQENSKPILMGVLCEVKEHVFNMVALDGFRLAIRRYHLPAALKQSESVVPSKSFIEISRTLLDSDELIKMQFSSTHLLIDMGHTRIISRLLEGSFLKYEGILPTNHVTRVRIRREELLESIDRAILLAREGSNNLVRFSIEQDMLRVSANSAMGKLEEEISIHLNGEPIEIAFNARYFSDVLKNLDDEDIFMDMTNNISPCIVRPVQGEAFYYLILPVRVF